MPDPTSAVGRLPAAGGIEVISLPRSAQARAIEVLTRAFLQDPIYLAVIPNIDERRRSLQALWGGLIATCRRYGLVHTTPDVAGVACWLAPGRADLNPWQIVRTGLALPRAMMHIPAHGRKLFIKLVAESDRIRHAHMPRPHWYLWSIGVDPSCQGRGIGGALLDAVLTRADAEKLPCYLETESEANVRFYTRRGFNVVYDGEMAGLRMWSLARPPRPGSGTGGGVV